MLIQRHIDRVYKNAPHVRVASGAKLIVMSDCHRGGGSRDDFFARNHAVFYHALSHYYQKGYTFIDLGDGDDIWKHKNYADIQTMYADIFALLQKFNDEKRRHVVYGNHDNMKANKKWRARHDFREEVHSGLLLDCADIGRPLFLLHGHQADPLDSTLWRLARFLVRYPARLSELLFAKDTTGAAKNYTAATAIEKALAAWAERRGQLLIAGHTHRPVMPRAGTSLYFNDGCGVHPHGITGLEIVGGCVSLIRWRVQTQADGGLCVGKDILAGPEPLTRYSGSLRREV